MIRLIPLGRAPMLAGWLSEPLADTVEVCLSKHKQAAVLLNRRGEARMLLCQDCGYMPLCPACDIAMRPHRTPKSILACHRCGRVATIPTTCPNCQGNHIKLVGSGSQAIEAALSERFPTAKIVRVDSDAVRHVSSRGRFLADVESADIIVGTKLIGSFTLPRLGLFAVALAETEIGQSYDSDERFAWQVLWALRRESEVLIQTYGGEHPFLQILLSGHYGRISDFLLAQRQTFGYPPYGELANVHVSAKTIDATKTLTHRLVSKLMPYMEAEKNRIIFDPHAHPTKVVSGGYALRFSLQWHNLRACLAHIRSEIFRNGLIRVEWDT